MTAFIPTTTVTIRRAVSGGANTYGDAQTTWTSVAIRVPVAIVEKTGVSGDNQTSYQPNQDRDGVVELFTIRFRPRADVAEGDQLVDEQTGAVYQARDIYTPLRVVGQPDLRVLAVRTGAASRPVNG